MSRDLLPEGPTPEPELGPADDVLLAEDPVDPVTTITGLRAVLGDVTADHPDTADWPLLVSTATGTAEITDVALVSSESGEWVSLETRPAPHPDDVAEVADQ